MYKPKIYRKDQCRVDSHQLRLIEIADGVSINPTMVTSVRKEKRRREASAGNWSDMIEYDAVVVYLTELDGEYSDTSSLMYRVGVESKYTYEETLELLMSA